MHLREIDGRIEPLRDVIVGIGAGLAAVVFIVDIFRKKDKRQKE